MKTVACFFALGVMLSGCKLLDRQDVRTVGAAELKKHYSINGWKYSAADILTGSPSAPAKTTTTAAAQPPSDVSADTMSAWLGAAGADSIDKCNEFLARLSVAQTGSDTSLDILALATGGAAAVAVLPATTAAGLAAGSTFATGTRALIDSDVYGKAGATVIVAEIKQDYYPQIKGFLTSTQGVTKKSEFIAEYGDLLAIHSECSLQAALYKIGKSGGSAPARPIISMQNLADGQSYTLISGAVVSLKASGSNFILQNYYAAPVTLTPVETAALLNAQQATLNTK